jgi:uncharacterized protein (TIGR03000 family)
MVKKQTLLAALGVAALFCSASTARAGVGWLGVWSIERWHDHYAAQGRWTRGWDYASGFGHGSWGAHPRDWAIAIAVSARPWPPCVDHYLPHHHRHAWSYLNEGYGQYGHHAGGRHHGGRYAGYRGYGFDDCCDHCGVGWASVPGWGHGGGRRHHRRGGWGYGDDCGYGDGPLEGGVYDDVNGILYDGGYGPGFEGAEPRPGGPSLEYDPGAAPKKEGELVEPPMPPKKTEAPATTKLVLNVPADAKVTLAGIDTKSSGASREFVTTLLSGSAWTDYSVRVEVERDGQTLVEERSVTLHPGDSREMTIEFNPARVASK